MGIIDVDIRKSADQLTMKLKSPQGTTAIVGVPRKGHSLRSVSVNGKLIWNGAFVAGQEGVTWKGEDDKHLLFLVKPGEWTFTTG